MKMYRFIGICLVQNVMPQKNLGPLAYKDFTVIERFSMNCTVI